MRRPDAYARLPDVSPNVTVSPARRARSVAMHARISASVAGFRPIVWADVRPGAISSTVWIALASTEAWRVSGLVTAGNNVKVDVWAAASPIVTNVSRHSSWLSRIPAPSKPAASTSWISRISSGIGAVPGSRSET
jgi:hypothetical protein